MLASNYMQRCLTLAGCHTDMVAMREERQFRRQDPHDAGKNLILLCSPKSNPTTQEFLSAINQKYSLNWTFERLPNGQFEVHTDGGRWASQSYLQAAQIKAEGGFIEDGPFDDVAMVIKVPNPHNPRATIFIVAGVRGIGTWGAAYHLRENAKAISKRTKGRRFAMLIKVHYRAWRIETCGEAPVFF